MSLRYARNLTPTKDQYARRCVCMCASGHMLGGWIHSCYWDKRYSHAHRAAVLLFMQQATGRWAWSAQAAPCGTCWVCWGSAVGSHRAVWRYTHRHEQQCLLVY